MQFRIAILLAIFALVAPARASDAPVSGGPGGQPFKFTCNDGSYLVGLKGFYGHWIDQISPVCAPWLPSKLTFGMPKTGIPFGESQGSFPGSVRCPMAYVVNGIAMTFTFDEEHRPKHLDDVTVFCATVTGPPDYLSLDWRSLSEDRKGHWISHTYDSFCPAGEAATGIHGRSGLMVDAMGLVCAPAPQSPTAGALTGPGKQGTTLDRVILQPKSGVGQVTGPAGQSSQTALVIPVTPPSPPKPLSQTYEPPLTKSGKRLHACKDLSGDVCGALVATAFCQLQGFLTADDIDTNTEKVSAETLGGEQCTKKKCKVFDRIVCNR
jgi:hypothetical protein